MLLQLCTKGYESFCQYIFSNQGSAASHLVCASVSTLCRDLSGTTLLFLVHLFKENCEVFESLLHNFVSGRKKQKTTLACRYTERAGKIRFVVLLHNLKSKQNKGQNFEYELQNEDLYAVYLRLCVSTVLVFDSLIN